MLAARWPTSAQPRPRTAITPTARQYAVGEATSTAVSGSVFFGRTPGRPGCRSSWLWTPEFIARLALKQILDTYADDPTSRQRFLEAEVAAAWNIQDCPSLWPGTYGDGRPYYAMRFVKGDSLKEAIDRFHGRRRARPGPVARSLEQRKLLPLFTDVCNAIDYAHSRGVLHRDIKPGSIIVNRTARRWWSTRSWQAATTSGAGQRFR